MLGHESATKIEKREVAIPLFDLPDRLGHLVELEHAPRLQAIGDLAADRLSNSG
jgi:hypothetical protein